MRSVFAVAVREIRELRLALAGAAIIGLLPLVPLFWPAGPHPVDVEAALLAELIACALLAAVTGATIIGGDLADRKLGFYFARPIPGWSIWAGKVAGGAGVVAAGSILALLPGVLAARGAASGLFTRSAWPAPRDILLILAALYCVTIGLGIVLRSRSGFAAFDALAFAASALVSATILRNLVLGGVVEDSRSAAEIAAALFGGAVLSASAAGIAAGRVDRRRVHAIFSTVLWSLTAIAIAAAGGLELWIHSASPASIDTVFAVTAAPKGPWIEVAGLTGYRFGYTAEFLVDPESGRFLRLGGGLLAAESLAYSADGRRAAWWEAESGGQYSGAHLAVLDLAAPGNRPRQTKIARPDRWGGRLVLDRDGTRVAMLNDEQISIYEIASDRLLLSVGSRPRSRHRPRVFPRRFDIPICHASRGHLLGHAGKDSRSHRRRSGGAESRAPRILARHPSCRWCSSLRRRSACSSPARRSGRYDCSTSNRARSLLEFRIVRGSLSTRQGFSTADGSLSLMPPADRPACASSQKVARSFRRFLSARGNPLLWAANRIPEFSSRRSATARRICARSPSTSAAL